MWYIGIDKYALFLVYCVFSQKRLGAVNVVRSNYIVAIALETLKCILHIIGWVVDVIVANEAIIVLAFPVQEQIPPIFLEVYVSKHDMQLVLVELVQLRWDFGIFIEPEIEIVALSNKLLYALHHPLASKWEGRH